MRKRVIRSAFTLIELLVVIGVIAVVAGVLALGLTGGGGAVALQGGQATLSSLITGARGKAAISNSNAAIVVWGDPTDPDSFLRKLAIFNEVASGVWQQNGDTVYLPKGVYVVPPEAKNSSTRAKLEPADSDWVDTGDFDARSLAANATSASTGDPSLTVREPGETSGSGTEKFYRLVTVTSLGRLSGTPNKLVIALGERDSDSLIVFREPESARGLQVSTYGIATLVNEKTALKD